MPARCWNNYYDNHMVISSDAVGDVELNLDLDVIPEVRKFRWTWDKLHSRVTGDVNGARISLQKFLMLMWKPGIPFGNIKMLKGPFDFRKGSMYVNTAPKVQVDTAAMCGRVLGTFGQKCILSTNKWESIGEKYAILKYANHRGNFRFLLDTNSVEIISAYHWTMQWGPEDTNPHLVGQSEKVRVLAHHLIAEKNGCKNFKQVLLEDPFDLRFESMKIVE